MALVTIQEYADLNEKDHKLIEYHLRVGNIKSVRKYGKRLIDSRTKCPGRKNQPNGANK